MRLNPFNFLKRPPHVGGGKVPMSQLPPTAPRSAPTGEDRLSALLDVVGRLAEQQKLLLDVLKPATTGDRSSPTSASSGPPATPTQSSAHASSQDEVRAIVRDLFREQQTSAARDAYARDHLADLPEAYRRLLPTTGDAALLASAEQRIRQQFRDDLKAVRRAAGEPAGPTLGGDKPGGHPPAAAVDYSKLSPLQQIAVGLRTAGVGRTVEARKTAAAPPADVPFNAPSNGSSNAQSDTTTNTQVYDPAELFVGAD